LDHLKTRLWVFDVLYQTPLPLKMQITFAMKKIRSQCRVNSIKQERQDPEFYATHRNIGTFLITYLFCHLGDKTTSSRYTLNFDNGSTVWWLADFIYCIHFKLEILQQASFWLTDNPTLWLYKTKHIHYLLCCFLRDS
jgi:hypothetical protein